MTTQETLLIALRGRFGDSQTAIADATGMSLSRVNNYIRGKRTMDDDAVIACCELLGWNAQKYVAAHRAETATTKREVSFWRKIAATAAILIVSATTLPGWGVGSAQAANPGASLANSADVLGIMRNYRSFLGLVALWLKWRFNRPSGPQIEAMSC